jgi:hypothetical protein
LAGQLAPREWLVSQALPQPAQLAALVALVTHWLAQQSAAPPEQLLPQPPQLSGSWLVSMQNPPQQVPPPGQPPDPSHGVAHWPAAEQLSPAVQSLAEMHCTH